MGHTDIDSQPPLRLILSLSLRAMKAFQEIIRKMTSVVEQLGELSKDLRKLTKEVAMTLKEENAHLGERVRSLTASFREYREGELAILRASEKAEEGGNDDQYQKDQDREAEVSRCRETAEQERLEGGGWTASRGEGASAAYSRGQRA